MKHKNDDRRSAGGDEGMVQIGECPICGQPIYWRSSNPGQKPVYCSVAHRQKAYRERLREQEHG